MRKKYFTLEEYRAANALRQKEWRRKRRLRLGLKPQKRGRKPKHQIEAARAAKTVKRKRRGLELAIN